MPSALAALAGLGALRLSLWLWRDGVLLSADMERAFADYAFAAAWPSAGLLGPTLLMLIALALHRAGYAARITALAGLSGVALALALTLRPAWEELAARAGTAPSLALLGSIPTPTIAALVTGLLGIGIGLRLLTDAGLDTSGAHGPLRRARSDNHGHADWLAMKDERSEAGTERTEPDNVRARLDAALGRVREQEAGREKRGRLADQQAPERAATPSPPTPDREPRDATREPPERPFSKVRSERDDGWER